MRKFIPRKGQVFKDREELVEKLEDSGWEREGQDTGFKKGEIVSYNVGVQDKEGDLWLMIDLRPVAKGIKVTKVKKLKISDYRPGGKYWDEKGGPES